MYIISNTSRGILTISDMGVEIPANQARDLDKLGLSMKPEDSRDLEIARKAGKIKIVKSDHKPKKVKKVKEKTIVKEIDELNHEKIAAMVFEKIKGHLPNQQPAAVNQDQEVMMQMLKQLLSRGGGGSGAELDAFAEENNVDPKLLREIHKKTVNNMVKGAEVSIEYEKENQQDTSVVNNADELEDMI
jgi:hypothetical protein